MNRHHIWKRVLYSPLFWLLVLCALLLGFASMVLFSPGSLFSMIGLTVFAIPLAIVLALVFRFRRKAIYEGTLAYNIVKNTFFRKKWSWWSCIDASIVLGAIPLKNQGHLEKIICETGISAVLTMLETFELRTEGLLSMPVQPEDWKREDVEHLHIATGDFRPVSMGDIDTGVEFLARQIAKGRKVYVHCKAGRGRSATIVLCYFMKYQGQTFEEALDFTRKSRPQICLNGPQVLSVQEYHRRYCDRALEA